MAAVVLLGASVTPLFAQQEVRKIVVFKPGVSPQLTSLILAQAGATSRKHLAAANAHSVIASSRAVQQILEKSPLVEYVEEDVQVHALETQSIPWGISRIHAPEVWNITTADSINVGVIDTGIDLTHDDLIDNIKGGYNAINPALPAQDDNGHGTHVAGTIGAANNALGVIGAGPAINLYAIKVLGANGSGYLSDVVEGLDWARTHGIQVVNMSLGTSSYSRALEDAVRRASKAGMVMVAAAGNSGPYNNSVNYPARFNWVIAVSALDSANKIASFSSRGSQVDLSAPGVAIPSTYKGNGYATFSGTSMASPHVAAAAALLLSMPKKCDSNGSGYCNPDEIKERLESTATDLGSKGKDSLYGAGLINVQAALQ